MRDILENYNEVNLFWDYNPQYKIIDPFKSLYKNDRTKNKKKSSEIMWSIALIYHPSSDLYYIANKEEKVLCSKLKLKEDDVKSFLETYKQVIDSFIEISLSQAEKSLISWEERLKQRDEFISTQHYHFKYVDNEGVVHPSNVKELDDMNSKTGKLYDEFFKIKKELYVDDVKNDNKGYDSSDLIL